MRQVRIGPRLAFAFGVIVLILFAGITISIWLLMAGQDQILQLQQQLDAETVNNAVITEQTLLLEDLAQRQQQAIVTIMATGVLVLLAAGRHPQHHPAAGGSGCRSQCTGATQA